MNKLFNLIALVFIVMFSPTIFAQEATVVENSQISEGVKLVHGYTPGEMGSFDKLFIEVNSKSTEIFNSEGRKIKEVFPIDIDSDSKKEYLISMDCGGSGGYYDLTIIKEKDGSWVSIWEDSLVQPKVSIKQNDEKTTIRIESLEVVDNSPKKIVTLLNFRKDGISEKVVLR